LRQWETLWVEGNLTASAYLAFVGCHFSLFQLRGNGIIVAEKNATTNRISSVAFTNEQGLIGSCLLM